MTRFDLSDIDPIATLRAENAQLQKKLLACRRSLSCARRECHSLRHDLSNWKRYYKAALRGEP